MPIKVLFVSLKKKGHLQIIDVPHGESEGLRGFPGSKDYDKPYFLHSISWFWLEYEGKKEMRCHRVKVIQGLESRSGS